MTVSEYVERVERAVGRAALTRRRSAGWLSRYQRQMVAVDAVRRQHADVRALDDVAREQRARHAPHLGLDLRVGPRATFEDECRPRPPPRGDVPDEAK